MALQEFYRVLKSGGQMVHGELIQAFENDAQRLMIEANLHSARATTIFMKQKDPFYSPDFEG